MAMRHVFRVVSLGAVLLGIAAADPGFAQTGGYSRPFLDVLNETCWNGSAVSPQRDPSVRRALVRVYLANPTDSDLSQICVYDLTCGEVVFSGRIQRGSRRSLTICPDSSRRGGILVLDPFGRLAEYRDLASPATIQLRTLGRR